METKIRTQRELSYTCMTCLNDFNKWVDDEEPPTLVGCPKCSKTAFSNNISGIVQAVYRLVKDNARNKGDIFDLQAGFETELDR